VHRVGSYNAHESRRIRADNDLVVTQNYEHLREPPRHGSPLTRHKNMVNAHDRPQQIRINDVTACRYHGSDVARALLRDQILEEGLVRQVAVVPSTPHDNPVTTYGTHERTGYARTCRNVNRGDAGIYLSIACWLTVIIFVGLALYIGVYA